MEASAAPFVLGDRHVASSLRIARGELGEVSDQLDAARDLSYLEAEEYEELKDLCTQALKTNAALLNHLDRRMKRKKNGKRGNPAGDAQRGGQH